MVAMFSLSCLLKFSFFLLCWKPVGGVRDAAFGGVLWGVGLRELEICSHRGLLRVGSDFRGLEIEFLPKFIGEEVSRIEFKY